jgi:hypothetical protein
LRDHPARVPGPNSELVVVVVELKRGRGAAGMEPAGAAVGSPTASPKHFVDGARGR